MIEHGTLSIQRLSNGLLIKVAGRGTMWESQALKSFLAAVTDRIEALQIDLSDCSYLDSTFIGHIVALYRQLGQREGTYFALQSPSTAATSTLESSGLLALFTVDTAFPDVIGDAITLDIEMPNDEAFKRHVLECHEQLARIEGPHQSTFVDVVAQMRRDLDA